MAEILTYHGQNSKFGNLMPCAESQGDRPSSLIRNRFWEAKDKSYLTGKFRRTGDYCPLHKMQLVTETPYKHEDPPVKNVGDYSPPCDWKIVTHSITMTGDYQSIELQRRNHYQCKEPSIGQVHKVQPDIMRVVAQRLQATPLATHSTVNPWTRDLHSYSYANPSAPSEMPRSTSFTS
jgi:hypothetical protein